MTSFHRIALVDDHRMFVDGFSALLDAPASGYDISTFADPLAFLEACAERDSFDLAIIDLVMKGMNGLALLAAIRKLAHPPRILMLSGISTDPPLTEMRRLGADGFVSKTEDISVLLDAVKSILAGESVFPESSSVDRALAEARPEPWRSAEDLPQLGPRQLEVLKMIGQGATNKAIAETLNISENTVKSHMRVIFDALNVRTRTACHHKAVLMGLL
jgi:DNA-binding NarL/FixJ family response regulator